MHRWLMTVVVAASRKKMSTTTERELLLRAMLNPGRDVVTVPSPVVHPIREPSANDKEGGGGVNDSSRVAGDDKGGTTAVSISTFYKTLMQMHKRVYDSLGTSHTEHLYACALEAELTEAGIKFDREVSMPVIHAGHQIGVVRADIIATDPHSGTRVPIELKAKTGLSSGDEAQLRFYLRTGGYKLGILMNFVQVRRPVEGPISLVE